MKLIYPEEHQTCCNYIPNDLNFGFKILSFPEGEVISSNSMQNNLIVFVLKGSIELECNDFEKKHYKNKEFFFLSQSSSIKCKVLTDCRLIVFSFTGHLSLLCENSNLLAYSCSCSDFQYNMKTLNFNKPLECFLVLMEMYLQAGVNCLHLHDLKKNELFLLFRTSFSKKDIYELFYPIIGADIDFRSKVLKKYQFGYSTKAMADALAMSTTNFSRTFQREFGVTFYRWTLLQKAKYVRHKLSSPHVTISDIIHELGFTSSSHFNKFCKSEFGHTPTEFIRHLRLKHKKE